MSSSTETALDDLAYLRGLLRDGGNFQHTFGEAYFAAGLVYGAQMLLHAMQHWAHVAESGLPALLIGVGPTAIFVPVMIWISWRHRQDSPSSAVGKAVGSVFGAVGLANLVLIAIIGSVALREKSLTIWLLYPCIVMLLQGLAWMVVFMLRRRLWTLAVALGWFAISVAMAIAIRNMGAFIAVLGFGMLAFMLVPGALMMRTARRQAAA